MEPIHKPCWPPSADAHMWRQQGEPSPLTPHDELGWDDEDQEGRRGKGGHIGIAIKWKTRMLRRSECIKSCVVLLNKQRAKLWICRRNFHSYYMRRQIRMNIRNQHGMGNQNYASISNQCTLKITWRQTLTVILPAVWLKCTKMHNVVISVLNSKRLNILLPVILISGSGGHIEKKNVYAIWRKNDDV